MNILFIGLSSIVKNRIIPAVETISTIVHIDCASFSKTKESLVSLKARNFYSDYETALLYSDAEIVYISVRNHEHAHLVKRALFYNKHVIVDKPAVTKIEDAEEIFQIASEKNKCISEAIVYAFHPQLDIIKNLFKKNNSIPSHITVHFTMPGFIEDNFRYYKEFDGGALFDLGPYAMSLGFEIFGADPITCIGTKNIQNGLEVETSFNILLQYSEGRTLIGYFGFETEYMNSVSIFSKEMRINFERVYTIPADYINEINVRKGNETTIEKVEKSDIFKEYLKDVINGITNNEFKKFNLCFLKNAKLLTLLRNNLK